MKTAIYGYCSKLFEEGMKQTLKSLRDSNDLTGIDVLIMSDEVTHLEGATIIPPFMSWKKSCYMFQGFLLDYDRVVYLQADELYIGNIDKLLREPLAPIAYVPNAEWGRPEGDPVLDDSFPVKGVHTGGMIVHPKRLPSNAFELLTTMQHEGLPTLTDQKILTTWIREQHIDHEYLSHIYSMAKRYFVHQPGIWNRLKDDIRVLHYVGMLKPWTGDEQGYEPLGAVWRDYPNRSLPEAQ